MSFFDELPPSSAPSDEPEYRPPVWSQPPENMVGAAVALDLLLVRREELAVAVPDAIVYPTGVAMGVVVIRRRDPDVGPAHRPWFAHPGDPDGPRYGVAFADGRRASADTPFSFSAPGAPEISLLSQGGGGSERRFRGGLWLWPLPPPGPVTLAFMWKGEGVEETIVEIDSEPLRAAAERALELWPDDRPEPPKNGAAGW